MTSAGRACSSASNSSAISETREPATAETLEVYRRAMDQGVIFGTTRYAGLGNVLKVKPPFTITRAQMDRVLDVLDQVLTAVENR